MKPLILALLLLLVPPSTYSQELATAKDPFDGVKLNWLELRYRKMCLDRAAAAEKRFAEMQAKLDQFIAAEKYADQQKDVFTQKVDIAMFQKELETARDQLKKGEEILTRALANKSFRKQLSRDLKAALARENDQTAAKYAGSSSYSYPYTRNFRVDCYSGGYGRYVWVRCRSTWY